MNRNDVVKALSEHSKAEVSEEFWSPKDEPNKRVSFTQIKIPVNETLGIYLELSVWGRKLKAYVTVKEFYGTEVISKFPEEILFTDERAWDLKHWQKWANYQTDKYSLRFQGDDYHIHLDDQLDFI